MLTHVSASLNGLTTIRSCGRQIEGRLIKEFDRYQDEHSGTCFLTIATNTAFGLFLDFLLVVFNAFIAYTFVLLNSGNNKNPHTDLEKTLFIFEKYKLIESFPNKKKRKHPGWQRRAGTVPSLDPHRYGPVRISSLRRGHVSADLRREDSRVHPPAKRTSLGIPQSTAGQLAETRQDRTERRVHALRGKPAVRLKGIYYYTVLM